MPSLLVRNTLRPKIQGLAQETGVDKGVLIPVGSRANMTNERTTTLRRYPANLLAEAVSCSESYRSNCFETLLLSHFRGLVEN